MEKNLVSCCKGLCILYPYEFINIRNILKQLGNAASRQLRSTITNTSRHKKNNSDLFGLETACRAPGVLKMGCMNPLCAAQKPPAFGNEIYYSKSEAKRPTKVS